MVPPSYRHWLVAGSVLALLGSSRAASGATPPREISPRAATVAASPNWSRSAEKKALLDIRQDAQQRVRALVVRMNALPEGPALEALSREAQSIKRQSDLDFLSTKLTFARGRGDLTAMHELEEAIELMVNPSKHVVSPAEATRAASPDKGGQP
jgi:hypothetical protein